MSKNSQSPHEYFMAAAMQVSQASTCLGVKVGAVIVKDQKIVATGCNSVAHGLPSCMAKGQCYPTLLICTQGTASSMAIHAELAAIGYAASEGVATKNTVLYVTKRPCANCLKVIAAARIPKFFYLGDGSALPTDDVWRTYAAILDVVELKLPTDFYHSVFG